MKRFLAAALTTTLLVGCVSGPLWDKRVPTANELIGSYSMSWGGICSEVDLRADQSYSGMDCAGGHFGPADGPDRHFSGRWTLQTEVLTFSSTSPTGKPDLGPAEVFFYKGSPAFVELSSVDKGKTIHEFVFTRRSTK